MSEKSNFYVFEKKEVLLVIVFVILVAITSFFFGLKIGSNYAFEKAGMSAEEQKVITKPVDMSSVDLTSPEEEEVKKLIKEKSESKTSKEDLNKRIENSLKEKMINEFSDENRDFNTNTSLKEDKKEEVVPVQDIQQDVEQVAQVPQAQVEEQIKLEAGDEYTGKYTIVVGSFESVEDAKEFAEGFRVLGFSPIVNEKDIPGKGNRFRVSLGAFERIIDAKQYVKKNRSLFAGRDYFFTKFD